MSGSLETVLGTGGSIVGGAGGAGLGALLCGPVCGYIGRALGSQAGKLAGRAAAGWIANQMEQADVNAEAQTKATEAAVPCASCTKIKCFKPPKGSDEKQVKEFEKQLEEQQDAINEIPPDKLIGNLNKYAEAGRGPDDASARKEIRDQFLGDRKRELTLEYLKQGKSDAAEAAATEAAREASTLDAIHTPDLGAGGDGTFSSRNGGMGDRSVNRSIGSQWGKDGRLNALKEHAEDAKKQGKKTNVKLEVCPDGKKGGDPQSETPDKPTEITPGEGEGNGYGV